MKKINCDKVKASKESKESKLVCPLIMQRLADKKQKVKKIVYKIIFFMKWSDIVLAIDVRVVNGLFLDDGSKP